ncbi:squalene--hopene cyclase [Paenibacillus yonginensis]|uniref:Squalene--hopene cyclase n=1 Tax=Paenibacillus yonginensis TaxID=1462996 RepID=A0A1B1N1Q6_9BACL|nr:squalene--hopene cyclase [Paenibacillus yonginensis]ANS75367.1 squalene--hopene cyclase [Paenibacillus yonginensis]
MNPVLTTANEAVSRMTHDLVQRQQLDGTWHFCFENGTVIDALSIILFRNLDLDNEPLIRKLHDRILAAQQPEGCWRWYADETEGNLAASIEAYFALLYSGYSQTTDEPLERAKRYIISRGGAGNSSSILTKTLLSITGQQKWPLSVKTIPLEVLLLPASFPISLFDFSGYSRIHLIPLLIMADRDFTIRTPQTPDLSELYTNRDMGSEPPPEEHRKLLGHIKSGLGKLAAPGHYLHEAAAEQAKRFMLERIEADGTLYSYASSTILMVWALLALGYDKRDPIITRAVDGIINMRCTADDGHTTLQNSPSTVWDTALLAYALQEAGLPANHAAIRRAAGYLRSKQHHKLADWSVHNPNPVPGGWGFSDNNSIVPDVDDTTAALRAICRLARTDDSFRDPWNRGLNWVISMQNKDGGWPAFEKNTDKEMLTWLAIEGAKAAATDPSEADLTGRTLEYFGSFAGLNIKHKFIKRGADWLIDHQEKDGSWYGRWGVCYIYGTWAALTGLSAVGIPADHDAVTKAVRWLLSIQNPDGGWGESCRSDVVNHYVPLGQSTPSQTAWALDALIAASSQPIPEIERGIVRLAEFLPSDPADPADPLLSYPTGAGLPGNFYTHYHSYRHIWPLLTFSHYRQKYQG